MCAPSTCLARKGSAIVERAFLVFLSAVTASFCCLPRFPDRYIESMAGVEAESFDGIVIIGGKLRSARTMLLAFFLLFLV